MTGAFVQAFAVLTVRPGGVLPPGTQIPLRT
jgi:hypothetical protein